MEMNKYSKGKIYMIITENSSDIYVGSTIQTLKARLQGHVKEYRYGSKYCSSQDILEQGDYKIVLIKNYPCSSLNELEREESNFQRDLVCVNKRIEGRTQKEWYKDNREVLIAKQKEYYNDNREVLNAYYKAYHIKNREARLIGMKEYKIKNREALLAKHNQKFTCECGGKYTYSTKARHFKTEKHKKHINIIT